MKIGIITMHSVLNYGSTLQAYALQQKLFDMGFPNELIDYQYVSPEVIKDRSFKSYLQLLFVLFLDAIMGFPRIRKRAKFRSFRNSCYVVSKKTYNKNNINGHLPKYDIYLTGSDQVWNPRFIGNDANFMLAFAPDNAPKISYASSFATNVLEDGVKGVYNTYLSKYLAISVREKSGVKLVKDLTGKDAAVCCDPTILLKDSEWEKLANKSNYKIHFKYILVYVLSYMFDPYPDIYDIIRSVQNKLNYKVIYLVGRMGDLFRPSSRLLKSAGPEDFVYLFKNAEMVITTSFHGASFALINDKPLIGIIDKQSNHDSRIQSLLESVNATSSIMDYRERIDMNSYELLHLKGDPKLLNELRQRSTLFLKSNIEAACHENHTDSLHVR